MKKLTIILSTILMVGLISCGNEESDGGETVDVKDESPKLKGYEELNLTTWGYYLSIMVPNSDANGAPNVTLNDRGTLEIVVGSSFGVEIMFADMDIKLLKADLNDHLIYSHEILKEDENSLIYTQDIPEVDSGVKTQNHFFYQFKIGSDFYIAREIFEGAYSIGMIKEMLSAAKTIKEVPVVVVEDKTEV